MTSGTIPSIRKKRGGTVLIAVAGILSVLALMAFSLAMILRIESKAALNSGFNARVKQGFKDQTRNETYLIRQSFQTATDFAKDATSIHLGQDWYKTPGPFASSVNGHYITIIEPMAFKEWRHIDDDPPFDMNDDGTIDFTTDLDNDNTPNNDQVDNSDNNTNQVSFNEFANVDNDGDGSIGRMVSTTPMAMALTTWIMTAMDG